MILQHDGGRCWQRRAKGRDRAGKHQAIDVHHVRSRVCDRGNHAVRLLPRVQDRFRIVRDETVVASIADDTRVMREALNRDDRRAGRGDRAAPARQRVVPVEQRIGCGNVRIEGEIELDDPEHPAPFTCSM